MAFGEAGIPTFGVRPLSDEAKQSIEQVYQQAQRPAQELETQVVSGIGPGPGLLEPGPVQGGSGQVDLSLVKAIHRRANIPYAQAVSDIRSTERLDAQNRRFHRLQKAADLVAQEQQLNHEVQLQKYEERMARRAARSQMMGTVLGIVGAATGAYVGGPSGALAGYQVGQGVGQTAGRA